MRERIEDKFLNVAEWQSKDYDSDTYSDVYIEFMYQNYNGEKSTYKGEELIRGWLSTDEGRKIVTRSNLGFKREDRIYINGSEYIITEIFVMADKNLNMGALRGLANRDDIMLVLS